MVGSGGFEFIHVNEAKGPLSKEVIISLIEGRTVVVAKQAQPP